METITRQLRGIPDWVLKEYLESLGGQLQPDGWFTGPGWQARFTRLPDEKHGPMVFQCYQLEFQGDAETLRQVWPRFELKILRPGG